MTASAKDPNQAIGLSPEQLTLEQRHALVGKYIALEIYQPATLPFRRIEAIGSSVLECVRMLRQRGLETARFEFSRLQPPY